MDPMAGFAPYNFGFGDFAGSIQNAMQQMGQVNAANQQASLAQDAMNNNYQTAALKNQRYDSLLQALTSGGVLGGGLLGGLGGLGHTRINGFQATGPSGKVFASGSLGSSNNLPLATAAYDKSLSSFIPQLVEQNSLAQIHAGQTNVRRA